MVTPIFYDGFEKIEKFYIRYDFDRDLEIGRYVDHKNKNALL